LPLVLPDTPVKLKPCPCRTCAALIQTDGSIFPKHGFLPKKRLVFYQSSGRAKGGLTALQGEYFD
jgi:hypothetical protein